MRQDCICARSSPALPSLAPGPGLGMGTTTACEPTEGRGNPWSSSQPASEGHGGTWESCSEAQRSSRSNLHRVGRGDPGTGVLPESGQRTPAPGCGRGTRTELQEADTGLQAAKAFSFHTNLVTRPGPLPPGSPPDPELDHREDQQSGSKMSVTESPRMTFSHSDS